MRAAMTTLVQGLKRGEREGVVFPRQYDDHGNLLYELSLLSTGGTRQFDTDRIITRYEARQAMAILGDFVMIGHEATGTQALIRDKSELFRDSLGCILDMICGIINSHAIPRLLRLNGDDVSLAPKLAHESVRQIDLGALTGLVTAFNKTTTGPFADPNSEASRFVLGQAGIPVPSRMTPTKRARTMPRTMRSRSEEVSMTAPHTRSGVALSATASTTTQTSADLQNPFGHDLRVIVDMLTVGTGSITVVIKGKDVGPGSYFTILSSAAIIANGQTILEVGPELTAAANSVAKEIVPDIWQVVATANNANPTTYEISYELSP
jgi:hypothetical protein